MDLFWYKKFNSAKEIRFSQLHLSNLGSQLQSDLNSIDISFDRKWCSQWLQFVLSEKYPDFKTEDSKVQGGVLILKKKVFKY